MPHSAENGLHECACDSMGGRFGAHRPECPWQVAYEAQLAAEKDAPSQEVREAWEQAHGAFCPRGQYCSTHLRPGNRWMLSRSISPEKKEET